MFSRIIEFTKEYRANFIGMIFFITCSGLLVGVFPYISGWIIDNVIIPSNKSAITFGIIALISLFILTALTQYLFIYNGGKVESGVTFSMRQKGFEKLQRLSFSYYDKTSTGQTMSRLTGDISSITNVLAWNTSDMIFGCASITVMSIIMLLTSWRLGLLVLTIMPFIYVGGFFIQNKIFKKYKKVRKMNGEIINMFNEGVMGSLTIKTMAREEKCINEFRSQSEDMMKVSVGAGMISGIFTPYIMILGGVATLIVLYKGGLGVINKTGLSYGTFVSFLFYAIQFYVPIYRVSEAFIKLQNAKASAVRFFELLDTKEEIIDTSLEKSEKIKGDIDFIDVSFSYVKNEPVLQNFNLSIKKGECIALVGETGGGKSTIVNLACRFYEPTGGKIHIDGKDYKDISQESLHSSLGYVLQQPYLFDDTIWENVRYGKLNATNEQVIEACKTVNAHSFIEGLENGYNTKAGENGRLLSAGQRQLLALARAVLADPSIFILDEATATVDTETERNIQEAIDKVLNGRTSFIIAHRLTTVVNADRILVINNGRIVEEGNHQSLLDKRGYYFNLYIKQFYNEKEDMVLQTIN